MQSQVVLQKIMNANLAKTGEAWPNRWGSTKFKQTLRDKYGVDHVRALPGVHSKTIESIARKTTELLPTKIKELENIFDVTCLSDLSSFGKIYRLYDHQFTWRHRCSYEYESGISERGIKTCPRCSNGTSRAEREIGDLIIQWGLDVKRRDKTLIGKELDLVVPSKKIAIEFDGTYWHSADFVSKEKALEKQNLCEDTGVQLLTIQEHLWVYKREQVLCRLRNVLGLTTRSIGARKTRVLPLTVAEAREFFSAAHLQGAGTSQINYGLFFNEELVAAASFSKPRFSTLATWELVRFATAPNTSVPGGAGKLLNAFTKAYPGAILSYADRCWSTGNLYRTLGFSFVHNSAPSYFWVSGSHVFSRYQTQKKKLARLLQSIGEQFDPDLSEVENMLRARFLKVYDRGNSVWLKQEGEPKLPVH